MIDGINPFESATSVVKRLVEEGYIAYFAGGWVRDHLLGELSEEIDIATNAPPEIILSLFPKTVSVGISFGVVIVMQDSRQIEVATFRRDEPYKDGRHPEGVIFSSPEEDAKRRDFTINGMFYDPLTHTLFDFVGGQEDLSKKIIRAIGDPELRFAEDKLRMIRAVRFSARFRFPIEKKTEKAIIANAHKLFPAVSMERIFQEFSKMSRFPHFDKAILDLYRLGLLQTIFPPLKKIPEGEIAKRAAPLAYFPKNCPTILYLTALFPYDDLSSHLALCRYLKTSVADTKLTEFFYRSKKLHSKKEAAEAADWAKFYANSYSDLFLAVETAYISSAKKDEFLKVHEKRRAELKEHIERIQLQKPLVTAAFLQKQGILPGKEMGSLLKEAERISINQNLKTPEEVLLELKKLNFL